jgi:hypothetical protein
LSTTKNKKDEGQSMRNQEQYQLQAIDYPTIIFELLDVTNVDKSCIVNGFCNNVSILIRSPDNKMFCSLVSKYIKQNGYTDISQIPNVKVYKEENDIAS